MKFVMTKIIHFYKDLKTYDEFVHIYIVLSYGIYF